MISEPLYSRNTTHWVIPGTKGFRLGSRAVLSRWGTNLQNIEKSMREIYEADPGKLLCQPDQAGAEALVVAHLMPPGNTLLQLFENRIKIHNYMSVIFPEQWEHLCPEVRDFRSIPIPELRSHPKWAAFEKMVAKSDDNPPATRFYYHYKQAGHSGNYNIHAPTFIDNIMLKSGGAVRLTRYQGEKLLEGYHTLIPTIRGSFHKYIANMYEKNSIIWNLQGFPITITQKVREEQYSKIYDKCPQSTVGTITNEAFTEMQTLIEDNKLHSWDMLQNNHDSFMGQANGYIDESGNPQGEILDMAKEMQRCLRRTLVGRYGEVFTMGSGMQIGKNWSPYKKDKNEEGLKEIII